MPLQLAVLSTGECFGGEDGEFFDEGFGLGFFLCGRKIEQHMEESRIWNFMV